MRPEEPADPVSGGDAGVAPSLEDLRLTDTQRQILEALCRPRAEGNRYATPATNQQIAGEVFLSVDAVKAHLRVLYRKFGVEPLPHNQKRARLVELALEGKLVEADSEAESGGATAAAAEPAPPPGGGRRPALIIAGLALVAAVAIAAILISGGSEDSEAGEQLSDADYHAGVNQACRLAISGDERPAGTTTTERALQYLGVIETMRRGLDDLGTPPESTSLERFRVGLEKAADYTRLVAQEPPPPGSAESANAFAELTIAAGLIQAGAIRSQLDPSCAELANLVSRSARNAAGTP